MTWLREARCVRAAALIAATDTPLGRGACMAPTASCWLSWLAAILARCRAGLGGVGGDGREARGGSAVRLRDQRGCRPERDVPALSGWPGRHRYGCCVVPG